MQVERKAGGGNEGGSLLKLVSLVLIAAIMASMIALNFAARDPQAWGISPSAVGMLKMAGRFSGVGILWTAAAALLLYYFAWWRKVGRDPPRGIIIPLFEPPAGKSPAMIDFYYRRGSDVLVDGLSARVLSSLVDLAVKKYIAFVEDNGVLHVENRNGDVNANSGSLPPEQRTLYRGLFPGTVQRAEVSHSKSPMAGAMGMHDLEVLSLTMREQKKYQTHNIGIVLKGALLAICAGIAGYALAPNVEPVKTTVALAVAFSFLGALLTPVGLLSRARTETAQKWVMRGVTFIGLASLAFVLVFCIAAPLTQAIQTGNELHWIEALTSAGILALMLLVPVFAVLLHAPTGEGRKLFDEIDGFRLYLDVAESNTHDLRGAPNFTFDVQEKYLAHAIALGIDASWTRDLMKRLGARRT